MATIDQLKEALKAADAAGDTEGATKLANAIRNYQAPKADSFADDVLDVAGEIAAGANRAAMYIPDTLVKGVNLIPGVDIPTPSEAIGSATGQTPGQGGFMDPGLARDAAGAFGEVVVPGAAGMKAVQARNLATVPGAAAEFLGFGSASPTQVAAQVVAPQPAPARPMTEAVQTRMDLANRVPDAKYAGVRMTPVGEVVPNPAGIEAVRQGLPESKVSYISQSTPADKQRMLNMFELSRKGEANELFKAKNRPWDVVGDTVTERINAVMEVNREAGKEIGEIARGQAMRETPVSMSPAIQNFQDGLQNFGIRFVRGDDGKAALNFVQSDFGELPGAQRTINQVFRRLQNNFPQSGSEWHKFKNFLDEVVSEGKLSEGGLSGNVERFISGFRRAVDDQLDATFPDYNAANTTFRETREALDSFTDAVGKRIDPENPRAVGQVGRRILSNTVSREQLNESLASLNDIAARYGVEADTDLTTLALFADEMERLFKAAPRTSLAGQTGNNIQPLADLARNPSGRTLLDVGLQAADATIDQLRGVNEEGLKRSLEELLRQ